MARASGYFPEWCVRGAALSALLLGCRSGGSGGPEQLGAPGGGAGPMPGAAGNAGAITNAGTGGGSTVVPDIGVPPVGRLNRTQYDNTVHDLLGTALHPAADGFPADELVLGFDTIASALRVQPEHVEKYLAASDALVSVCSTRASHRSWRRSARNG